MKKISIVLQSFLFAFILVGYGCTENQDEQTLLEEATGVSKSSVITIEPSEFEDRFGWYVGFLPKDKEYHVVYNSSSKLFELYEDQYDILTTTVVCQGDGVSFVNCVRIYLDENPGVCLCICNDSDGYEATTGC
jgi:hypothetical protein